MRVHNFSSGPAAVDESVLRELQNDMLDCRGSGMSILEMNHRSSAFGDIMEETSERLARLLSIPDNYEIIYVNGGGYFQFSAIPQNLLTISKKADFIDTDIWTKYAIIEAEKFGTASVIASSADKSYTYVPRITPDMVEPDADYLYVCTNNTASGTAYRPYKIPETGSVPLVADMTSNFMSEGYDISRFGLVFAAAQKNLGPAGVSIVIIRRDLLERADPNKIPRIMCYSEYVKTKSTFSTPATFAIYMILLVLKWVEEQGGIAAMSEQNHRKSMLMYDFIDNSRLFNCHAAVEDRSLMNVVFTTERDELDKCFAAEAESRGLCNLSGYAGIGGLRAGIYNGVSIESVNALVSFMKEFEKKYQ